MHKIIYAILIIMIITLSILLYLDIKNSTPKTTTCSLTLQNKKFLNTVAMKNSVLEKLLEHYQC